MATVVTTKGQNQALSTHRLRAYRIEWTADENGSVEEQIDVLGIEEGCFVGEVLNIHVIPAPGDGQPSDNYSATLSDENGVDILAGSGESLPASRPVVFAPSVLAVAKMDTSGAGAGISPLCVFSRLSLSIRGAGRRKQGAIVVYLR